MVHFKLVNSAFLDQTTEVAFYHSGRPPPADRWSPEPGPGASLRICANAFQLKSFNALKEGALLVLVQNIAGVSQTVTHVSECVDPKPASPTSEWPDWPHERRFRVLARLDWRRFGGAGVGPHGDRLATHRPRAAAGHQDGPVRLRHLLSLAENPTVANGRVRRGAEGAFITSESVLREITELHGFELVPGFAGIVRAAG